MLSQFPVIYLSLMDAKDELAICNIALSSKLLQYFDCFNFQFFLFFCIHYTIDKKIMQSVDEKI